MRLTASILGVALISGGIARAAEAPWVPDLGNGSYKNPVLYADYSDPDAIRVGSDFWLVSSSFSHAPGLPILHSRDLVNWTIVNHALPTLPPADHFAIPRPGEGVWAPAIREHAGTYYIFYPDPDFGIYCLTARDPAGRWSAPTLVKSGRGLIDPCPLWDDDGKVYMIHGWAKSRSGINNRLTVHQLTPDAFHLADEGTTVVDANLLPGWTTLEGPKLYKRHGYYYIFAPAGGVTEGYQAVFRSRSILGPYENRVVLAQGHTNINGPHQGAWVDTPSGENWFLHFQDQGPYGRVVHLEPMQWRSDDWPVIGSDPANTGKGEPVLVHAKPDVPRQPIAVPATTDEFDAPQPNLAWQWQANPNPAWLSVSARRGWLRLFATPSPNAQSLWLAPNLLLQKFPAPRFRVVTKMEFAPRALGDSAGLLVFGYDYAWVGLRNSPAGIELVLATNRGAQKNGTESFTPAIPLASGKVWLAIDVTDGAICHFSYSGDGTRFTRLGGDFQATVSRWVGAKVGVFALAAPGASTGGAADFDWFRVSPEIK